MQISHENEIRMAQLRAKRAAGAEFSIEEMREIVAIISAGRRSAAAASASSKRHAASSVVRSAEEMLAGLPLPGARP